MNLNTRITWAAWTWVNSTVDIIADLYAELGYDLISDIEYESRIKWWVNFFDVNISDSWDNFLTKYVDIVLAFNDVSLVKQLNSLKENATIIINKKWVSKLAEKNISIDTYNVLDLDIADKYENTYLLWIYSLYLNIDINIVLWKIEKVFSKKWEEIIENNKNILKNIYDTYKINKKSEIQIKKIWEPKKIYFWNKAITAWAIEWWLDFYSAYPMTPASTILTEVIKDGRVTFIQNEDEIAVVNSALWASFTWARAMCGTSGGWFALMTEALSFAVQAEFPITIVLAQRAGPSTGTPTYHEAWDLNFALNPTFGDFNHVVLYPSNLEEAYYYGWLALNIADKYQTQVILLTDKQAAELHWTVWELNVPKIDRWIILDNPPLDYKRYELTENWISPRVKVWTKNGDFIATSYEHDEFWATTENSQMRQAMTEKRFKKLENFFEKEWISGYEIITSPHLTSPNGRGIATKLLITTSFTSYTAKEFVKNNPEFSLMVITILKPINEIIRKEIEKYSEIIFVEANYSGQLENYLTKEFGLKYIDWLKISHLRKYDLFPFYLEDFNELK